MRRGYSANPNNSDPGLVVWDTQYCAPSDAYTFARDAMRSSDLPWTVKQIDEAIYCARMESISVGGGILGRAKGVPIECSRTKSDIAHSSAEWLCAFYILSGTTALEQGGRTNLARKGDLIFFDSTKPVKLTGLTPGQRLTGAMGLAFPKALFSEITAPERLFENVLYPRERILNPLASTLLYTSNRLVSASYAELTGLFHAIADLVPIGMGGYFAEGGDSLQSIISVSLPAIVSFIEENLTDPTLSAAFASKELRISESYVHRVFAAAGTTFGAYMTAKRLDRVRVDLISPGCRRTPISVIAYKWGFNDLSTFNRSFKRRFGCTPKALRS